VERILTDGERSTYTGVENPKVELYGKGRKVMSELRLVKELRRTAAKAVLDGNQKKNIAAFV